MKKNHSTVSRILNQLDGAISPEDREALTAWLEKDSKNREEYGLIVRIVREGQKIEFPEDPDVREEWKRFEFPAEPRQRRNPFMPSLSILGERLGALIQPPRFAFIVFVLCLIGASIFWHHQSIHGIKTVATANRQQREVTLPDGSTVYLNAGTELSYPKKFRGAARNVSLNGEAYFEVIPSKTPFIVETQEGTVTVLGTKFNIWARDFKTRVVVEEGRVQLAAINHSESVVLTKDLMSEIEQDQHPAQPHFVNAVEALGWREGKLVFTRTELSELAGEVGRYYDVDVSIKNPVLETKTITAVFDRLPLQQVLYAICSTLDIQYKVENGKYIFYIQQTDVE